MGGRYPYNAQRIDWFLGSLFENREDVVEVELSLVEVSVFTQSCFDSIYGLIAKYLGFERRNS